MRTKERSGANAEAAGVEWLSPTQLAAELQVPLQTVYWWRSMHQGPRGHKIGKYVRFSRADINAWLETIADIQR